MNPNRRQLLRSVLVSLVLSGCALVTFGFALFVAWWTQDLGFFGAPSTRDDFLSEALVLSLAAVLLLLICVAQWLWAPMVTAVAIYALGAVVLAITSLPSWDRQATALPGTQSWWNSDGWLIAYWPVAWPVYGLLVVGIAKRLRESRSRSVTPN